MQICRLHNAQKSARSVKPTRITEAMQILTERGGKFALRSVVMTAFLRSSWRWRVQGPVVRLLARAMLANHLRFGQL